ncbi:MAG: reverse transcriptase family protein, partial [Candidatus Helarchaeota archaeon]
ITFIGKGYSSKLNDRENNEEKLHSLQLPILETSQDLADFLQITHGQLKWLCYHKRIIEKDHYTRFSKPKRSGGTRPIRAPKPLLKGVQRIILDKILYKIPVSDHAYGYLKGRSTITAAERHFRRPTLVINLDIHDFFPTITFERIRGMFCYYGYSGHISTLLSLLCTYCERKTIQLNGKEKFVATSHRTLPQGAPTSPMITNIICKRLDKRLNGLARNFGFRYTRFSDDMSFSKEVDKKANIGRFCYLVRKIITEEGFDINPDKTQYLLSHNCQSITSIVINNREIGLTRKWVRNFRAAIYNAKKSKGRDLSLKTKSKLEGMVTWARNVNSIRYERLIKLALKVINS